MKKAVRRFLPLVIAFLAVGLLVLPIGITSQPGAIAQAGAARSDESVPLAASHTAPPGTVGASSAGATFEFRYTAASTSSTCDGALSGSSILDFPVGARAALEQAGATWGAVLSSPVPIVVQACWASSLPNNWLGTGRPTGYGSGSVFGDTFYPIALADALAGKNLTPGSPDIVVSFAGNRGWYTGPNPSGGGFSTVALHELGHGLGFIGGIDYSSGLGVCSSIVSIYSTRGSCPTPYDQLATDGAGVPLLSYPMLPFPTGDPAVVGRKLTTESDAYFSGPNALARHGGARIKLYTPFYWEESSYTHLDGAIGGGADSLMTPSVAGAVAPGSVTVGIMRDIGWPLVSTIPQVDLTGPSSVAPGAAVSLSAAYRPAATSGAISYAWQAADQADVVHTGKGVTDSVAYTWTTTGRKRVTVVATGPDTPAAAVFEVNVQTGATPSPTPGASPTPSASPTPGGVWAFLPFVVSSVVEP